MLSGTKKSVALKYEESDDLTLIHKPHDEANEVLRSSAVSSRWRKSE